jgi:plastocyanin
MRKAMLAALAAALGVLVVVLPGVAGSETSPTVTAMNGPGEMHSWSPSSASVGEGGSVTFSNPTTVPHGVEWIGGPAAPVCGGGVPVGTSEAASGTKWSGSCTFMRAGTYTFYCTVHGAAMSGTIAVAAGGGEPPAPPTTTSSTPGGTTTSGGQGSSGGGSGPGPSGSGAPAPDAGGGLAASPFSAGASALKLARSQRGSKVRGAVGVSSAGVGGTLEVELLAKAASPAAGGGSGEQGVGKLERIVPRAGAMGFAVGLNARGRRALGRKGRLALTVEVKLTPRGGRASKLERSVVLRTPSH